MQALFYATGRPAGDGRPAEPPGLVRHAEVAIAELWQADRMGEGGRIQTAIVDRLLGGRPELQLLLMDQDFPIDPFRPEPGSDDDPPDSDSRGPKP